MVRHVNHECLLSSCLSVISCLSIVYASMNLYPCLSISEHCILGNLSIDSKIFHLQKIAIYNTFTKHYVGISSGLSVYQSVPSCSLQYIYRKIKLNFYFKHANSSHSVLRGGLDVRVTTRKLQCFNANIQDTN